MVIIHCGWWERYELWINGNKEFLSVLFPKVFLVEIPSQWKSLDPVYSVPSVKLTEIFDPQKSPPFTEIVLLWV